MAIRSNRKIVIAIDDSPCALDAAKWAYKTIVRPGDDVHLLGCTALISAGMAPAAPLATAGAVTALAYNYHQALRDEEARVKALLKHVKEKHLAQPDLHCHCLPAAGGASGVGESIVSWARKEHADLVIVGSRGMGSTKSSLMSIVGLGSVSSYLLHHLNTAVCIVHGNAVQTAKENEPRKALLVAVDDSPMSKYAQTWAIENLLGPNDQLHLVAVAQPVPYVAGVQAPVGVAHVPEMPAGDFEAEFRGSFEHAENAVNDAVQSALGAYKIAADDAAAAHVLENNEEEELSKESSENASEAVHDAVAAAIAAKVSKERIFFKALEPEGGASDVGLSIKHYAEANSVDIVVVGSRGMGALKRAVLGFIGLGSVSDWCSTNMSCPVVVVKAQEKHMVEERPTEERHVTAQKED